MTQAKLSVIFNAGSLSVAQGIHQWLDGQMGNSTMAPDSEASSTAHPYSDLLVMRLSFLEGKHLCLF